MSINTNNFQQNKSRPNPIRKEENPLGDIILANVVGVIKYSELFFPTIQLWYCVRKDRKRCQIKGRSLFFFIENREEENEVKRADF